MKTILIIDDTQDNIEILNVLLGKDYEIIFAMNGSDGISTAELEKPDLILLDIIMPIMNGYETCKHLKSHEITKDIPILFLTALSQDEVDSEWKKMGAVDIISKPFDPDVIKNQIKKYLHLT